MDIKERTHKEVLQDALADSNVKQEYEALDGEFQIRREHIQDIKKRRVQLRKTIAKQYAEATGYDWNDIQQGRYDLDTDDDVDERLVECLDFANDTIRDLSSLGLVFKVEGELQAIQDELCTSYYEDDPRRMEKALEKLAGYTLYAPIEEK